MSFEGYYQLLCENGHEYHVDCYMFDSDGLPVCPICMADAAWWNIVDVTNGAYYNDERIDGYINLEALTLEEKCKCLTCGNEHIAKHATYKMPDQYLRQSNGQHLPDPPKGWTIIQEGGDIPQEHVECIEDYSTGKVQWADPRRCHSTMTPMHAMVWGGVRAVAKEQEKNDG